MLDKLFRAHSEKNGLGEKNGGAAMNGTASTKENPGVRRELSERPTPDMLRRTDSMTAFHAQKEFQDRTVSIGNDEREYFVSGCLLLLDCARGDLERVHATVKDSPTLVNFWDYDRRTPLHVASSEGRADVVKYLLAHDARPNRSDRYVEVIVQAGLDQSVHTTKSKNLRRGSIQSRKRVAKKQPSPAAMPSFYQHQAGGNHQPPDRQQSMDNCKCTIC